MDIFVAIVMEDYDSFDDGSKQAKKFVLLERLMRSQTLNEDCFESPCQVL